MVLTSHTGFQKALASYWESCLSWSPELGRVAFALIPGWPDASLIGWPISALTDCLE